MTEQAELSLPPQPPPEQLVIGQRLNRRERELVKALNDMACAADDDVPLFWFRKVFTGWLAPQSEDRKARVRFVLEAAMEAATGNAMTVQEILKRVAQ